MDSSKRYSYHFPTAIRFGDGVIDELPDYLKKNNLRRPLFVTDKGLVELDVFKKILKYTENKGIPFGVFCEIDKNPVKSNVAAGVLAFKNGEHDSIIGLGGGASMDVARAIALWTNHQEHDLFDFDDALGGDKYVINEIPHLITVPTTSGTGSEVGRSTVISDDETHAKKVLFSPRLVARIVFADPRLSMGLPAHITAATGIDALTHNIEAYSSKGFNPLCDGIAIEGIKLIAESLVTATKNPTIEARSKMMMAALMGATSFQKGLGIIHSLAHPLSTVFNMHHGLANACMLTYGMKYNLDICEEKFSFLNHIVGTSGKSGIDFIKYIDELNDQVGMPTGLKIQKIPELENSFERLADLAFADVCHLCNPKEVGRDNFLSIYQEASR